MHVLYLLQHFTPPDGSGGSRASGLARRLVAAGHRVTIVTGSGFFPKSYEFKAPLTTLSIDGAEVRVLDEPYSNKLSYARRLKAFFSFALRASAEARRVDGVDLVFASSTPLTIAIPAIAAKRRHRVPMVFEVRDLWPEVPIALGALRNPLARLAARLLERLAYREADRVIALSPGMKAGVVRCGKPADLVTVVPNSSDVGTFRVPASAGQAFLAAHPSIMGGPLVVYAGTLGTVNGAGYLVEIAANMLERAPEVRFLIVGDGKEREQIERRAMETGTLGKNLWMLPRIPKTEMPGLLSACALSVSTVIDVPELWNNSANKFFDALAAGRPMLINHEGWLADAIRASGAGLVVPPADAAAAAALTRDFLRDPERRRRAGEAAAALADGEFNRERLFERFLGVLASARGR